jgi:hypothetical protein
MRKPTYSILVIALASMLVAQPLSAFAQRGHGPQGARSAPHIGARSAPHIGARSAPPVGARSAPHRGAPLANTPLQTHNFGGHVYHGRLAWRHGRWHHAMRNGRFGWWWDVGGIWYFYPEETAGPPDYVSDIEAVDENTAAPASPPPPPDEPHYALYYRPGDFLGTRYQTLKECSQARQQAGNVGVCVMK